MMHLQAILLTLMTTLVVAAAHLSPPEVFPPTCDGCFCVPDESTGYQCPSSLMPKFEFNFTTQLKHMTWKNPIHLECNPYPNSEEAGRCHLTDSRGNNIYNDLGPEAVCGIRYDETDVKANMCFGSYETRSFASRQDLEDAQGFVVTHLGACGACSSTHDLAIYLENPNLQQAGTRCAVVALSDEKGALECYQEVGFSRACAAVWLYDTVFTRENCLNICLPFFNKPPNLNESQCPLNDCIRCNEVVSGPFFKRFAGRTRRGSGMLSYIIRNCSELVWDVQPLDPCPNGFIPGLLEEEEDADSNLLELLESSAARQEHLCIWWHLPLLCFVFSSVYQQVRSMGLI